jgi:hypothetical protein
MAIGELIINARGETRQLPPKESDFQQRLSRLIKELMAGSARSGISLKSREDLTKKVNDLSHLNLLPLTHSLKTQISMRGQLLPEAEPEVVTVAQPVKVVETLPQPEKPNYQVIRQDIFRATQALDRGAIIRSEYIPIQDNLVMIMTETYKQQLINLFKKERELTEVEASGRITLSALSKPFSHEGRIVNSREIAKLEFIEVGTNQEVELPDEGISPGEIDFHTHPIKESDHQRLDDHITIADVRAILEGPPWFSPDQGEVGINPRFRLHCIISIMAEKTRFTKKPTGRAVFTFYILDLDDESARKGFAPFGLKKLRRTLYIDF